MKMKSVMCCVRRGVAHGVTRLCGGRANLGCGFIAARCGYCVFPGCFWASVPGWHFLFTRPTSSPLSTPTTCLSVRDATLPCGSSSACSSNSSLAHACTTDPWATPRAGGCAARSAAPSRAAATCRSRALPGAMLGFAQLGVADGPATAMRGVGNSGRASPLSGEITLVHATFGPRSQRDREPVCDDFITPSLSMAVLELVLFVRSIRMLSHGRRPRRC